MRNYPPISQTQQVVHELQERESGMTFYSDVGLFASEELVKRFIERRITKIMNMTGVTEEQVRLNWRWRVRSKPVIGK